MSEPANSPLVGQVEATILAAFDVSPAEARLRAGWLAEEAGIWGGGGVALLDWEFLVRRKFGEELKWRSEADRQRFRAWQQTATGGGAGSGGNTKPVAPPSKSAASGDRPVAATPPASVRTAPAPKPIPLVDATPVEESPALTDEEQALGFELREVLHLSDVPGWEQVVQVSLPLLDHPSRLDAKGRTPDNFRTSVVKVLGESDAIFRARQGGKRVYSHLRFGYGSCWGYSTFGGHAAWHPVSDPRDSARTAVAHASVTQENPAVSVQPEKFPSRPAGPTP
jgi:hypothetical protein